MVRPLTTFAQFDSGNRFTGDLWTLFLEPLVSGMSGSTADTCTCVRIGLQIIWRMDTSIRMCWSRQKCLQRRC